MKLVRLVLSDLHLGSGSRPGELNAYEDFFHDDRFAELITHHVREIPPDTAIELILNGDIFDLLKIRIGGVWPTEITDGIATEKLRQCLDGHPVVVRALKDFMSRRGSRITYLPGNHDLDMWFSGPQELFRRYVAPDAGDRVRFITQTDTYYLPEGIQIRHGHQLERIHRVDYRQMTRKLADGREILALPWGSIWILEVMNPMKALWSHIDRVQPLGRFMLGSLLLDPTFVFRFLWLSTKNFLKHRVFKISAWRERIRRVPELVREEVISLTTGGYDDHAIEALTRTRGAHTLIVGHSHGPRYMQLPNGKVLVNTGTWVKMINLDLRYVGQASGLTYAVIEYDDDGKPRTKLLRWIGAALPYEVVPYAD